MTRRPSPPLLSCLLVACAAPPLGDDFAALDGPGRRARALEVLREAFASGADGAGRPRPALQVTTCDALEVAWTSGDGGESRLRWADVDTVEAQVLQELPGKPETLYLYLRPESPSTATVRELQVPLLSQVGVARPFLQLSQRPARSRARVVAALDELRARPPAAAAAARPAPVAPVDTRSELDRAEEVLERLRRWHAEGLITLEEYERKRREVLDRVGGSSLPGPARQE